MKNGLLRSRSYSKIFREVLMSSLIQLITALALLTQAQAATPAADDAATCERAIGIARGDMRCAPVAIEPG